MPEQLSDELQELQQRCHTFAAQIPELTNNVSQPRDVVRDQAKQLALFQMTQPKEFGGSAAGHLALTVAREALASKNPPYLDAVFGSSPGVLGGVDEPLKSDYLMPLLAGDKRGSFGFTEADDAPQPTSAQRVDNNLRINGQKSYVTGAADADFINTLVQIEDQGPSMVVIDTDLDGVQLVEKFSSLDGSHHAIVQFTDVLVPADHIVGEPGRGLPKAMRQIGDTRLLIAAHACGYMLWIAELLKDHLQQNDRSGQPRGNKDVVRWHYAQLRIQAYAARSMLYRTARLADQGENIINEAMACKVFATEAVGAMVDTAIQLVGGTALVDTHPLAGLYKKVRAWRLAEGASDVLRLNIGRGILELDKGRI